MNNSVKKWLTSAALGVSSFLGGALPTTSAIVAAASATAAVGMLSNTALGKEGENVIKALLDAKCTDQNGKAFDKDYVKAELDGKPALQAAGFMLCPICSNELLPAQAAVMKELLAVNPDAKLIIVNTRADTKPDIYEQKIVDAGIPRENVIILFPSGETDKAKEDAAKKIQIAIGDVPGVGPAGTHTFIGNLVGKDGKSTHAQSLRVQKDGLPAVAKAFKEAAEKSK